MESPHAPTNTHHNLTGCRIAPVMTGLGVKNKPGQESCGGAYQVCHLYSAAAAAAAAATTAAADEHRAFISFIKSFQSSSWFMVSFLIGH